MRDHNLGMKIPPDEQLDELLHLGNAADPRAMQGELFVDQQRTRLERDVATFADEDDPPPFASRFKAKPSRIGIT